MLKFASQVAPRGMFASGKGSTAAGLSAAVIREKNTFMLEAGVVVLADQGVACIDEFDKMKEEDRSALHEQMEQQTITIAKGGIYATLNARTAILAAANPILGKYDPYKNLTENVTLPIPLLTRFDLIFIIRDTPTAAQDDRLATHILEVHRKRGYTDVPPVQFDLLKKYLAYAKKVSPVLTLEAEARLKEYYLDLRKNVKEGQIGATPRTLESLIRLAGARARLMLRDQVTEEDALGAISLMNRMVEDVLTDTETKTKGDFGVLMGQGVGERGKLSTSMEIFRTLEGAEKKPVELKLYKEELNKSGRFKSEDEIDKMVQRLIKEGIIWENKPGFYRRVQA
jgi:replicative DNA helicase Mcm